MKPYLLILLSLLLCTSAANAGWFSRGPSELDVARERITRLENQLSAQTGSTHRWQIASGLLVVACVMSLLIGTALGANTRNHYDGTRRLGAAKLPPAPGLNGRQPRLIRKTAEAKVRTSLAA